MKWRIALLTGFGLGLLRPAPGTIGSLPPAMLALILAWLLGPAVSEAQYAYTINFTLLGLCIAFSHVCIAYGAAAEQHFGCKDPPSVVADEIAGQSIALLFLPWRCGPDLDALIWNLTLASTSFVAFRFMDIMKPAPARGLQRMPAGWGILVDDLIAGGYALAVAQMMAIWVWPALLARPV
jgi:phosphatidylglycerophosphatase A